MICPFLFFKVRALENNLQSPHGLFPSNNKALAANFLLDLATASFYVHRCTLSILLILRMVLLQWQKRLQLKHRIIIVNFKELPRYNNPDITKD
ncbi:hypothetical protein CEXT_471741 [Caerostris extrusa]|uniref:Uncharacterized protein n=1 Tax=Caerostris extrusa TaxID=172846 RepID=A0AAV4RRF9_CAEEX|nr:hypothetical protein CEXT_471741 [Caerostris extrusa]